MNIAVTQRLSIRRLESQDRQYFAELFTDPRVLEGIPQNPFNENQIEERFSKSLRLELVDLYEENGTAGIYEKGKSELIGLALFLRNEANEMELGYRFRFGYWGKGYGTEITQAMLEFYFNTLKALKVTADVNLANHASVRILDKYMTPVKEFFNERDQCTDRRYELKKRQWLETSHSVSLGKI
jgi:[ribosomal protein S5]-alanine N-acetyltransferase